MQEQVELAPYTTFRVGGPARYFVEAATESDLAEARAFARAKGMAFAVLGGGSNLLVPDEGFAGVVVHLAMRGVERDTKGGGELFDVAAGESWDELVDRTIEAGYAGMECLAGIPGSVGASPVQNIGAYGQEVSQTIASVRALDCETGEMVEMEAAACGFGYRRSIFNGEQRGRYAITRVRFRLRAGGEPSLEYADLKRWFAKKPGTPTLAEVAAAVRAIRRSKGMVLIADDPDTWSAGSYFKNPVVAEGLVDGVAAAADVAVGAMPHWPAEPGRTKLSAAWLLERAGFGKGYREGAAGLSTKHALALTNRGGATCAALLGLEEHIRAGVAEKFGVRLEREPVLLQP